MRDAINVYAANSRTVVLVVAIVQCKVIPSSAPAAARAG